MKIITLILCCSLPFSVLADIKPATPNYKVMDKTVLDAKGVITNDPQQITKLTAAEATDTKTRLKAAKDKLKTSWNKSRDGAVARANRNPKLIK